MQKFKIISEDPLNVLGSTKAVVENACSVFIDEDKLTVVADKVVKQYKKGLFDLKKDYGTTGDVKKDIQLIFIENSVNFCFWPDLGKPRWHVDWPLGDETRGGWYGLKACFDRALTEGVPILKAEFLAKISLDDAKKLFRGARDTEIPLIQERVSILNETGKILLDKYSGQFFDAVKESEFDAVNLIKIIIKHFPSFRDASLLDDRKVIFLKRAQICANDFSYIFEKKKQKIKNLDQLTAFADYKVPQVLRTHGLLQYSPDLAEKVDNMIELTHDSREEIEIRAATIWAVELLRQKINNISAAEIDNALWLMGQEIKQDVKPYHRTRTIYY